jgi:competence protein ComEC
MPDYLKKTLAETLGAQAAVLPIIAYTFKTISLISPIANAGVLWLIPLAMGLTFIGVFLGLLWLPLGKTFTIFIWPVLSYVIGLIGLLAKIPHASIQLNNLRAISLIVPPVFLLGFYLWRTRIRNETSR